MKTLALLLLVAVAQSKVYERCEWARVMKANGLDGFHGYSLANWVCLTKWESKYDTQAIHHNTDSAKSTDYGIFQINSRYWCDDSNQNHKTTISKNGCGIKCSQLLTDDVGVAISCAKRVVKDPNGMAAWYGWLNNCKGRDLRTYLAGCGL